MPRTYIKVEYFQYVELRGPVSVKEFAEKFGLKQAYAAAWLSKWRRKRYLTLVPYNGSNKPMMLAGAGRPKGSSGRYKVGPEWWGELAYSGQALGI